MSKYIYIMCATSESCDHYHACAIWDHKPSQKEIDRVKIDLDSTEFDPECDDEGSEFFIELDGEKYMCYISDFDIVKREIN